MCTTANGRRFSGARLRVLCLAAAALAAPAARAQTLPTDAKPTCAVSQSTFNTWFQSGGAANNGVVNPANGINFPNTPNCSFYQWAAQMFLWLTSPAPAVYGGGAHIFDSQSFFDLSTADAQGNRTLEAHTAGFIRPLAVRAAKLGPDQLPIAFTREGTPVQILPAQTITGPLRLLDATGAFVEVTRAARAADGTLQLFAATGAQVQPRLRSTAVPTLAAERAATTTAPAEAAIANQLATAHLPQNPNEMIRVQKFIIGGVPIFIDPFGNLVDVDQDQADGSVLMAQNKSLVYFAIMVNDVWAYFRTGVADNAITGPSAGHFPTSQTDLSAITTFASAHNKTFVDPDALAVEVKSSWIDASTLANPSDYITIQAEVPTYNTSNPSSWTPTGTHIATLALTGMHVVGSVNGHPEMIWATFEHSGNAPDEAYQYLTASGGTNTVSRSTAGNWLFTASGSNGLFNQAHMTEGSGNSIQATTGNTISPSDTIRWKAFGAASDIAPNPLSSAAASNSEVISVDNSVLAMLKALGNDVRQNYFLVGATWTIGGQAPTSGAPAVGNPGNQVGTSRLENATLETYDQGSGSASTTGGMNCMTCHQANASPPNQADVGVSFMFPIVKPLF
jgi:hypothetical protein